MTQQPNPVINLAGTSTKLTNLIALVMKYPLAPALSPLLALTCWLGSGGAVQAQVEVSGRLWHPRVPGGAERVPLTGILCFASRAGAESEPHGFRTWETEPVGWYRLTGIGGAYTLLFTQPADFMRPVVRQNIFTRDGEKVDGLSIVPPFDYASFDASAWDPKAATDYFQTFVARGKSVTAVGFKLAHDGVDGAGPLGQNVRLTIHRRGTGTPETWPQVGSVATVLNVDCGGFKSQAWSAGWNSGEVPLQPGETYAVRLRAEKPGGVLQAFWSPAADPASDCYRLGATNSGWQHRHLWMAVATDSDGLVIPFNKRVHRQFGTFAGFASKWTQTYVARGHSLAGVVLYAAVGGAQPPLSRQRVTVRVRREGPEGPVVGVEKIAIGNGNYTGDASWGVFGAAFAPEEVPLTPGQTYALEFESLENYETLHGFVNIKGQVSDDRPGFNPYRKYAPDAYEPGTAFKGGRERMDFDLDLQVLEHEAPGAGWAQAEVATNLLENGSMEVLTTKALPAGWATFALDPGTRHLGFLEPPAQTNHTASILGGSATGRTADGGYVQRVEGLSRLETYRVSGRIRSTWAVDTQHQCYVGVDSTGQTEDAKAPTIVWSVLPALHGHFVSYRSEPIRPQSQALSVWLRGRTTLTNDYRFRADFDDLSLRQVQTGVPRGQ